MRRITAIVCGILFIAFFRSSFGGSSAGHQVRIVVRHLQNQIEENTGIVNQTGSDLFVDPFRIDGERIAASLGLEGDSHHFRWVQNKVDPKRNCVTKNYQNEIETAFSILSGNAIRSKNLQFRHSVLNPEKKTLVYCTVTDVQ
jgi:hypothetical protein